MKLDSHIRNIFVSIISFVIIFYAVKLAGLAVDTGFWIIALLMLLIYFEIWDISDKKK